MEGFTHLIPFAAAHEVLRQGRRHLTLVRMTPDLNSIKGDTGGVAQPAAKDSWQ